MGEHLSLCSYKIEFLGRHSEWRRCFHVVGFGCWLCSGFLSFETPEGAKAAIKVMDGFEVGGGKLNVELRKEREVNGGNVLEKK